MKIRFTGRPQYLVVAGIELAPGTEYGEDDMTGGVMKALVAQEQAVWTEAPPPEPEPPAPAVAEAPKPAELPPPEPVAAPAPRLAPIAPEKASTSKKSTGGDA